MYYPFKSKEYIRILYFLPCYKVKQEAINKTLSEITFPIVANYTGNTCQLSLCGPAANVDITSTTYFSKPLLTDLISLKILNAFVSRAMSVLGEKNKSLITTKDPACVHFERLEYASNLIFPKL